MQRIPIVENVFCHTHKQFHLSHVTVSNPDSSDSSEAYFFRVEFFNQISDSEPPAFKSLPEDLCCSGFLRPEKIHRSQPGLNPRTLDPEASTLPRDHRGHI